ncbi:MAG: hypothetical protein P0Y65_01100 [Candidatus Devosia phytovorans]|uniref:Uncharacterized protein n=1 Tax=Candidatus Devosia phytovorans TaxID=3121372 RepID=A0AAJ6B1X3_9HYPH|nr:hypothetical protein [Devosia sp.]WEK04883.1 MAG: hypothetical protein P0Y65_01100 [Devosia sp.]
MRRILLALPALSGAIGLMGQPLLLALPPTTTALLILVHDRQIRRRVGLFAWPSDGFARHVLVDDMARLLCFTLAGLPFFIAGTALRTALLGP